MYHVSLGYIQQADIGSCRVMALVVIIGWHEPMCQLVTQLVCVTGDTTYHQFQLGGL